MSRLDLSQIARLLEQGKAHEAKAMLVRLLSRSPKDPDLNAAMVACLERLGETAGAAYYQERLAAARPGDPEPMLGLARLHARLGRRAEAVESARRATAAAPTHVQAWIELAEQLWASSRPWEAAEACKRGLAAAGPASGLIATAAYSLLQSGRAADGVAILRQGITGAPDDYQLRMALAVLISYVPDVPPTEVFACQRAVGELIERALPTPLPAASVSKDPDRRLRLVMVSPDFRTQSVAFFVEPIIQRLDRSQFEVVCVYTGGRADGVTERIRKMADAWHEYRGLREEDFAVFLRGLAPDILLDLTGYMEFGRLPAFHLRPAPVQATYCGYPNSTGLRSIDVRLVDSLTDPPGSESLATERLVRLDPCFLCYRPPDEAPAPSPNRADGPVRFGSFNALSKVSDRLIGVWSRVLEAVPDSTITLKSFALADPAVRDSIVQRFAHAGVGADRLVIAGPIADAAGHLAAYHTIDIALDAVPYNGTTTTCEAMYMGVPVVTLAGSLHAGRVGMSLLSAVGLNDLVGGSEDEFVTLAVGLANNPARRASLRETLRQRMLASPLCDAAGFVVRFQAALRTVWREYVHAV